MAARKCKILWLLFYAISLSQDAQAKSASEKAIGSQERTKERYQKERDRHQQKSLEKGTILFHMDILWNGFDF